MAGLDNTRIHGKKVGGADNIQIRVLDDGSVVLYETTPQTGATTTGTAGAAAADILAASTTRRAAIIDNEGVGSMRVAVGGTVPTATLGHLLGPGDSIQVPGGVQIKAIRSGAVDATWQASEVKD